MGNFTTGDTRAVLKQDDFTGWRNNGSAALDLRRARPLWFDGRFLSARDLEKEQDYFLRREADLGSTPGLRALQGLTVSVVSTLGQTSDIIRIAAGRGFTPAGEPVTVPSTVAFHLSALAVQPTPELKLGIATEPGPAPVQRTGLYAIGLAPVQYSANPITAFPTSIRGARGSHDGDIVEATSIALVPYPDPVNSSDPSTKQAALARQIFLAGNAGQLPDSLLPLALVSLRNGMIEWLDTYMLRRDASAADNGVRFGLTEPAAQQAYLQQYDSQLQTVVNQLLRQNLPARFAAADHFQALPPAGRFPLAAINTDGFTQQFFPPQMDIRLSVVPEDEIPALLDDSRTLPPIDLTLDAAAFGNLTVLAMIPVPRDGFAALCSRLPEVPFTSTLPQVLGNRRPIDLLRFFHGATGVVSAPPAADNVWQSAIAGQTYGFFVRRRSAGSAVRFTTPPPATTTTASPQTTAPQTTSTTTTPSPNTTSGGGNPTTTTATTSTTTSTTAAPGATTSTTTTPPPATTTTPRPTTSIIRTTPPHFTLRPPPFTARPPFTIRPQFTIGPLIGTTRPPE